VAVNGAAITALMPLRNHHPPHLRAALDSMRRQTSAAWRLLVIVEEAELDAWRRRLATDLRDPRVELVANEGRKLSGAFNTGMRRARTDYVAILLADDRWAPEAVDALQRAIAARPDGDFFHSGRIIVDGEDRPLSSAHLPPADVSAGDFLVSSPVKHLLCWRREKGLAAGGMDESLNCVGPDDYDFPWTMAERGAVFVPVPEALYVYRDHRDGFRLTTHLPLSVHVREIRRFMRKHGAPADAIERKVAAAREGYLRQCLYRNRLDAWLARTLRREPRRVWRDAYG
jgi:glycosyltransferase involved in cell wall biosynthesis